MNSFVDLTKYLFTCDGVKLFLSERLNQDPLESFFGKQRQRGGGCDNPTVGQFLSSTSSLRAQGSMALQPLHGNCNRKRQATDDDDDAVRAMIASEPLPKKKRKSSKIN